MRERFLPVFLAVISVCAFAADKATSAGPFTYQRPPKIITDVLESPATPDFVLSPTHDHAVLVDMHRHPPIAELSQPMLRLAGLRINPATNGPFRRRPTTGLRLVSIKDGKETKIALPANALPAWIRWAPNGKSVAFAEFVSNGTELWVLDVATAKAHKIEGVKVNGVMGSPFGWLPDSRTLLVTAVVANRGPVPPEPRVPVGPNVQESMGKVAPTRTYEDLLTNAHDEQVFDYYATAQLETVDTGSGRVAAVGKPAVFDEFKSSPDGAHVLVTRAVHPYTYFMPVEGFPKEVEVWDRTGKLEYKVASLPSEDLVPIEGVLTGPREVEWRADAPAQLVWAEALDEGNPKKQVPARDKLMTIAAPFKGEPKQVMQVEHRYVGTIFGEKGLAFVREYNRDKRWLRVFMIHFDQPGEPKVVWSRNVSDRYNDAGIPVMRTLSNGHEVMAQSGNNLFLIGRGASPQGDRPFLDRFDLTSLKSERVFQSAEKTYEEPISLLSDDGTKFLTRYESPTEQPNYYARSAGADGKTAVTHFPNPAPQLAGITKQLVRYKRADGVDLSFTLYLPPNYKEGTRLPTIVWAYPLEFTDASVAGQVSGSQYRFTVPQGMSQLWLVTQGYAVLDNATMPVVGDPETMNNTYVEQIAASAKAAIDKAADMGVTDPNRVGVGGHSYGAFMTANLLAHTDLFKAGVARSGAYNRTLTPFGFQSERRTFWDAPDMYMKVSPFASANKIKTPILLIHGEADDNSGTFPVQSERMYQALKGNGATVRYVTLPYEAHGYIAQESVEHTLWEMITWFDKWVKNAPAANANKTAAK
jgi:dipeptidyl aminopeptidase/acylaminoacyl peptidase